jgi:hypothetical protein
MQHVAEQYVPDPKLDWGRDQEIAAEKRMQALFDEANDIIDAEKVESIAIPPAPQIVVKEEPKTEPYVPKSISVLEVKTPERKYLELEEAYRANKRILEEMDSIVLEMKNRKGIGYHFQDPRTQAVFQIADRFADSNVAYVSNATTRFYVAHTRRQEFGEKSGTLSIKDAQALGYDIK